MRPAPRAHAAMRARDRRSRRPRAAADKRAPARPSAPRARGHACSEPTSPDARALRAGEAVGSTGARPCVLGTHFPPTPERCAPARPSAPRARGHACSEPRPPTHERCGGQARAGEAVGPRARGHACSEPKPPTHERCGGQAHAGEAVGPRALSCVLGTHGPLRGRASRRPRAAAGARPCVLGPQAPDSRALRRGNLLREAERPPPPRKNAPASSRPDRRRVRP
jgi:hypothetical protein